MIALLLPDSIAAVLASATLMWMAWMARQLMLTASANRDTLHSLVRLELDHKKLRYEFDDHISVERERHVGQLEQQLRDLQRPVTP